MFSTNSSVERWLRAAEVGDLAAVTEMLDSGFDVDTLSPVGHTALMKAVWSGHSKMIRLLFDRDADLSPVDFDLHTALTYAIERTRPKPWNPSMIPDFEPLELLLAAGARYELIDAFELNDVEMARTRLDEGADPNLGEGSYSGPLIMRAARLGHVRMIELLLDRGAEIEATDDLGQRALLTAAGYGQIEVVRSLLARGADLDAVSWSNASALANAAIKDHHEIVDLLLARGAKRGIVDALALNEPTIFISLLDQKLGDGREVDWIDDGRERLAILAARRGNVEFVRLLLDRGAAHFQAYNARSLLAEAAKHGHVEVVKLLLGRGARLDEVGTDGLTPLEWAIKEGRDEVAALLKIAGDRVVKSPE